MSFHLLDTNICIFSLNQQMGFERIVERLDGLERRQVGISAITVAELEFGAAASRRQGNNSKRLERFLVDFKVPFERDSARSYGPLRAMLQAQGNPIGPMDLLVAAHAIALKATLVTRNTREFQRVPGLRLEDWSAPIRIRRISQEAPHSNELDRHRQRKRVLRPALPFEIRQATMNSRNPIPAFCRFDPPFLLMLGQPASSRSQKVASKRGSAEGGSRQ